MFSVIDKLAACAQAPFGHAEPQLFRQAIPNTAAILDEAGLEALIDNAPYRQEKMSLVKGQDLVPREQHRTVEEVHQLRAAGATTMLRFLHAYSTSVARAAGLLANAIKLPMHANGYHTPPRQQGLPWHSDMDSVCVAQLTGEKTWLLAEPTATSLEDPVVREGWINRDPAFTIQPTHTLVLQAGDVLFLPRTWRHCAITENEASLHVSFGVLHPEIPAEAQAHQLPIMPAVASV